MSEQQWVQRTLVQIPARAVNLDGQRLVQVGEGGITVELPAGSLAILPTALAERIIEEGAAKAADVSLPAAVVPVDVPINPEPFMRAAFQATSKAWAEEMAKREKQLLDRPVHVEVVIPPEAVQVTNTVQPAPVTVVSGERTVRVERDPVTGRMSGATVS